jgi:hypothetical protein
MVDWVTAAEEGAGKAPPWDALLTMYLLADRADRRDPNYKAASWRAMPRIPRARLAQRPTPQHQSARLPSRIPERAGVAANLWRRDVMGEL